MTHLEKLAKAYEVENFFDYIIESQATGNFKQVRDLARELDADERKMLVDYCVECGCYGMEALRNIISDTHESEKLATALSNASKQAYCDGFNDAKKQFGLI